MAVNFFSKGAMVSEDVDAYVLNVKFQEDGADADVIDGAFVTLGDYVQMTDYIAAGEPNLAAKYATAPAALTDKVVAVDLATISQGSIAGNVYRMGIKLYDLVNPAGNMSRARVLVLGDTFYLGDGNFATAPTQGAYAILTADDVRLSASATQPATGFAVKVVRELSFEPGQLAKAKQYFVEVVQL